MKNKLNIKIDSLTYLNKVIIIKSNNKKYVYKNKNNYLTYNYLLQRGFNYIPNFINEKNSDYDLTYFIEDIDIPKEQRLKDLINVLSVLHSKTSFSKEIDLNDLKEIYENILDNINYLIRYYNDLNNYIDNIIFMSPTEYLLVRNIDLLYYLLDFVKIEITNWYNYVKEKGIIRYSMIHNNIDLSHIIENNKSYLISWDNAKIDFYLKDIIDLYKKYYDDLDLDDILEYYEKNNKITSNEYLFLLINLAIPEKIEFSNNTYKDTYSLSSYLSYLSKIALKVQKYQKIKQKS